MQRMKLTLSGTICPPMSRKQHPCQEGSSKLLGEFKSNKLSNEENGGITKSKGNQSEEGSYKDLLTCRNEENIEYKLAKLVSKKVASKANSKRMRISNLKDLELTKGRWNMDVTL